MGMIDCTISYIRKKPEFPTGLVFIVLVWTFIHWASRTQLPITVDDPHPATTFLVLLIATGIPLFWARRTEWMIQTQGAIASRVFQIMAIVWLIFWVFIDF